MSVFEKVKERLRSRSRARSELPTPAIAHDPMPANLTAYRQNNDVITMPKPVQSPTSGAFVAVLKEPVPARDSSLRHRFRPRSNHGDKSKKHRQTKSQGAVPNVDIFYEDEKENQQYPTQYEYSPGDDAPSPIIPFGPRGQLQQKKASPILRNEQFRSHRYTQSQGSAAVRPPTATTQAIPGRTTSNKSQIRPISVSTQQPPPNTNTSPVVPQFSPKISSEAQSTPRISYDEPRGRSRAIRSSGSAPIPAVVPQFPRGQHGPPNTVQDRPNATASPTKFHELPASDATSALSSDRPPRLNQTLGTTPASRLAPSALEEPTPPIPPKVSRPVQRNLQQQLQPKTAASPAHRLNLPVSPKEQSNQPNFGDRPRLSPRSTASSGQDRPRPEITRIVAKPLQDRKGPAILDLSRHNSIAEAEKEPQTPVRTYSPPILKELPEHLRLPKGFKIGMGEQTEVEEYWQPAVTWENVERERHEIIHEEITRDIHMHHYYTFVQPIKVVEILPARHFYLDLKTGQKTEVPAPAGWVMPDHLQPTQPNTTVLKAIERHYLVNDQHPTGILEDPPIGGRRPKLVDIISNPVTGPTNMQPITNQQR